MPLHQTVIGQEVEKQLAQAGHAVRGACNKALKAKKAGEEQTIFFNLCGHGHIDPGACGDVRNGEPACLQLPDEEIAQRLAAVPDVE